MTTVVITIDDEELKSLLNAYEADAGDSLVEEFFEKLSDKLDHEPNGEDVSTPVVFSVRIDGDETAYAIDGE